MESQRFIMRMMTMVYNNSETEERELLSNLEVGKRKMWYNRIFVLMEMVNFSRNRETCFLNGLDRRDNVRYLNIGSVEALMKQIGIQTNSEKLQNKQPSDAWHFFTSRKNYSIYFSLGIIDWAECPLKVLSYAHVERKKQQEELKESIANYIIDYFGGLDFDGDLDGYDEKGNGIKLEISREEAVNRALNEAKQVKEIFDNYKIKYFIQFSGSRGFHIIFEIPLDISVNQKCDLANDIVDSLKTTLDLKTIDKARLTLRKIFKTPYSCVTKDITRIVLPLDDQQINNFDLSMVEMSNVLNHKTMRIKNRNVIWRNENIIKSEAISNLMRFMSDFELKIPEEREYGD